MKLSDGLENGRNYGREPAFYITEAEAFRRNLKKCPYLPIRVFFAVLKLSMLSSPIFTPPSSESGFLYDMFCAQTEHIKDKMHPCLACLPIRNHSTSQCCLLTVASCPQSRLYIGIINSFSEYSLSIRYFMLHIMYGASATETSTPVSLPPTINWKPNCELVQFSGWFMIRA